MNIIVSLINMSEPNLTPGGVGSWACGDWSTALTRYNNWFPSRNSYVLGQTGDLSAANKAQAWTLVQPYRCRKRAPIPQKYYNVYQGPPYVPDKPSVQTATTTSLVLVWTAPFNGGYGGVPSGWVLQKSMDNGTTWTTLTTTTTMTYTDTAVTAGQTPWYQLQASNSYASSMWGPPLKASVPYPPPTAPVVSGTTSGPASGTTGSVPGSTGPASGTTGGPVSSGPPSSGAITGPGSSSGLPLWVYIVIAIAALLLIAGLIALVVWLVKRRRSSGEMGGTGYKYSDSVRPVEISGPTGGQRLSMQSLGKFERF